MSSVARVRISSRSSSQYTEVTAGLCTNVLILDRNKDTLQERTTQTSAGRASHPVGSLCNHVDHRRLLQANTRRQLSFALMHREFVSR